MNLAFRLVVAIFITGIGIICVPAVKGQDTPLRWHLADVLQIALGKSPKLRQARARVDRTGGQVEKTLAPFRRPTLTLTGSYTRLSSSSAQSSSGGGGAGPQNPFTVGLSGTTPGTQPVQLSNSTTGTYATTTTATNTTRLRQTTGGTTGSEPLTSSSADLTRFGLSTALSQQSVGVSLSQRIDITGLGRAYQSVSDAEKALARQDLEQTRQEIIYSVTTAYYTALRSEALIRVSEASTKQSEEQNRIARIKFDQGAYARSDVLRARSQLANNQQSLISARNQAIISLSMLANGMGVDPATPMTLAEAEEVTALPALPELDEASLLAQALAERPEAIRAALNRRKATGNVRIARQGQEPSLSASISGNYNGTEDTVSSRRSTGSIGLSFAFPLSDGGATAGDIRSARADERLAAAQEEEYQNGIKAEVEQAVVAVRDAHDRARSTTPALEDAREGYRLSEIRLKVGSGTQLALYDAQATLVQAEVNAINARYDYWSSLARLARAVGTPGERFESSGYPPMSAPPR